METVCQTCGVPGYSELLVHCSSCKIAAEHRYCLDKIPDNDELLMHWLCEHCKARVRKLTSHSKLKQRSGRILRHKLRKINHSDICTNKYKYQGNPCAVRYPLSLKSQNENFCGLQDTERSGSHDCIRRPSSSIVANTSKIDQPCAGLPQKEIQNLLHSSGKCVRDDKSKTQRRRLILAEEDEVDGEDYRHSSSKVIEDEKPKPWHRQLIITKDQDEPVPSSENAPDMAVKSKLQISAADQAVNKLQNCSLDASKSEAMMQAETHHVERNISGHQTVIDHQLYELARPVIYYVWSGCFEICNEAYGPIKAHLSNRACGKVCIAATKLPPVLQMVKLSKLDAWPRSFKKSPPAGDNIALFFFPDGTRSKSVLDLLLGEVISKDLMLKVVLDEAELLVFPSIVLPEVYHRFKGNHYLWGTFKGREVPTESVPASCSSKVGELPAGEKKTQDLEHVEEEISSCCEKSAVVLRNDTVAEEEQRADDSEPSGKKENVETPNVVVQNKKLEEEKQKVDGSDYHPAEGSHKVEAHDESSSNVTDDVDDTSLSNHLVILGKKIPATGALAESCPSDQKMGSWEHTKEGGEEQFHYDSTYKCLSLFPLRVEDMAIKSRVGGGAALDLELGLGFSAGDRHGKGITDMIFLDIERESF